MNLEQLREHPSFPFSAFKQSDLEFLLLEMFWVEFFRACLNKSSQVQDWTPLFPAERDGVPILVIVNTRINRAVRVHMRTNDAGKPLYPADNLDMADKYFLPFDLWLDSTYDSTGTVEYPGLVISTDMSSPALELARQIMSSFCRDETSEEAIRDWIGKYYETLQEHGYHWK
jgi:hypothetical protein